MHTDISNELLLHLQQRLQSIVMSMSVCLCVCLSVHEDISGTTHMIFTNFLCMLFMSLAQSSSGMLTIGRIAYRREGGDGSAQRGWSVIYDCLVNICWRNVDRTIQALCMMCLPYFYGFIIGFESGSILYVCIWYSWWCTETWKVKDPHFWIFSM